MSDGKDVPSLADPLEGNPFTESLPTVGCARCGEKFQRPVDLEVHTERHKPAPSLTKKEREGLLHCPKGCGRWVTPGSPDSEAHAALCDGSPPITSKPKKAAYRWWCEKHEFGTNGPRPWGEHNKEHHGRKQPKEGSHPELQKKEDVMVPEVLRLLKCEVVRLETERSKVDMEMARVKAAIKVLETEVGG